MNRKFALLLALLCSPASAQDLLVVESNFHSVLRLSRVDGSVIDSVFLNLNTSTGTAPKTPIQAVPVGQEIWIADRDAEAIFRFGHGGSYLGEIDCAQPVLGLTVASGRVWVTASGGVLMELEEDGTVLAVHDIAFFTDPASVVLQGGKLLVADVAGEDLDVYDFKGEYVTLFHNSDGVSGIDAPQQVVRRIGTDHVLAAGRDTPSGIYVYSGDGDQLDFIDLEALGHGGVHGVHDLENGNFLFTNSDGIHVYDTGTGTVSTCFGGVVAWYVAELHAPDQHVFCDDHQNPNNSADISIDTSDSAATSVNLTMTNAPANVFGFLGVGSDNDTIAQPPGNDGDLCIAGGSCLGRYRKDIANTGSTGTLTVDLKNTLSDPCGGIVLLPGDTWYFQFWHRRHQGKPAVFSSALRVTFH